MARVSDVGAGRESVARIAELEQVRTTTSCIGDAHHTTCITDTLHVSRIPPVTRCFHSRSTRPLGNARANTTRLLTDARANAPTKWAPCWYALQARIASRPAGCRRDFHRRWVLLVSSLLGLGCGRWFFEEEGGRIWESGCCWGFVPGGAVG